MSAPVSRLLTKLWIEHVKVTNKHPKEILVHPEIFEAFSNEAETLTRLTDTPISDEKQLKLKSCTMRPDPNVYSVKFNE